MEFWLANGWECCVSAVGIGIRDGELLDEGNDCEE